MTLLVTELASHHDRSDFDCGEPALNQYLQRLARQQSARNFSKTYVVVPAGEAQILGFYSISAGGVDFAATHDGAVIAAAMEQEAVRATRPLWFASAGWP